MEFTEIPRLARGVRFSDAAGEETTLMVPEGILRLKGPGRRILELCDGNRTAAQIVEALTLEFAAGDPEKIRNDVEQFLTRLRDRQVLQF
jgi:pyrroloquinoline quinone biosynthesis protein D